MWEMRGDEMWEMRPRTCERGLSQRLLLVVGGSAPCSLICFLGVRVSAAR